MYRNVNRSVYHMGTSDPLEILNLWRQVRSKAHGEGLIGSKHEDFTFPNSLHWDHKIVI